MKKYVDAIGLKETFCAECNHTLKCEDCDIDYHFSYFPAADVRENVHGEWITHKNVEIVHDLFITNYECSICHTWNRYNSNYCPNCGSYNGGDNNVHE